MGGSCLFGPQGPVIKIGVDLPLSGAEAGAAVPALNGIRYYVQQHPTLDGFTVVLSESDDSSGGLPDPNRGADNVRAFLQDPLIAAVQVVAAVLPKVYTPAYVGFFSTCTTRAWVSMPPAPPSTAARTRSPASTDASC